jgi:hypothetical protein
MNQNEYIEAFEKAEKEKVELDSVLARALDRALDIRKFEIELYWKRATYFWAFLAVTLAGYFAVRAANIDDRAKVEGQLILSCLGVVFSLTWYFVNRASKFWQENWEHHVNLLEGKVIGPLYETVLGDRDIRLLKVSGPYPFSVSKLNQILSLFVLVLFLLLMAVTLKRYYCFDGSLNRMATAMVSLTAIAVIFLSLAGGTGWWRRRPEERVNRVEAHRVTTKLPDPPAEPPAGDKTK